ncbi:hypothetical protein [Cognatazoarcus halotolerans]|uniref:hypothetical protein n=1 Tax=Cognatazoarcus halotolerans TaxID=2686016 RepID=UPI001356D569|nr:hypothetical protein [Cognatazoarcus halotolerans]MBX3679561.1 hypothetical protein [Rhodocyclaceae bacterium]MCB1897715.1 hypothetical protein [Rhodocyclaceae bacterium]MCP5310709.1 hypothetical protein [Zoogloeaceae bacterium]
MNTHFTPSADRQVDTTDLVEYLEQGRRMRSAALWNFATHLKPSIEPRDAQPEATPAYPVRGGIDTAQYMREGRAMRNAVMLELVASGWGLLSRTARRLIGRSHTAFS